MALNYSFITVPICVMCCYIFLYLCFLNLPKTKRVTYFRAILLFCCIWCGSDILMRLQVEPDMFFWYNVSLFGLLQLPVYIPHFLYEIVHIKGHKFLNAMSVVSFAVVYFNFVSGGVIFPNPQLVTEKNGLLSIAYTNTVWEYIVYGVILLVLIVVPIQVHLKLPKKSELRMVLLPILAGSILSFAGNVLEAVPGNTFPFGAVGGLFMALSVVYVIYRQNVFSVSNRLIIGGIYMLASVCVFLPTWILCYNIELVFGIWSAFTQRQLMLVVGFSIIWTVIITSIARYAADRYTERTRQIQLGKVNHFRKETDALFDEEKLYEMLLETAADIAPSVRVLIYQKTPENVFALVHASDGAVPLTAQELETVTAELSEKTGEKIANLIPLVKGEGECGFIYLQPDRQGRMNYLLEECYTQLCMQTSVRLQNIETYREVYESAIHDELTGLYSRTYERSYIKEVWDSRKRQGLLFIDIDDFKLFNELYGEKTGDDVLIWTSGRIRETVADRGIAFREGSNEFIVYAAGINRLELLTLAEDIKEVVNAPAPDKPDVLQEITVSIGAALYPETAQDADELLRQANKACHFSKTHGKNGVIYYSEDDVSQSQDSGYNQIAPTIFALMAAIDAKDHYTFEHSMHVSEYAGILAKAAGLPADEVRLVKEAGMVHDIGKIGIPDSVLKNPGRLNDEEYAIMKTHVDHSIEMIHFLPNIDYIIPAVMSHHERYDGKGYPRGIVGEEIPLTGRILAICDSFDAIVSKRPYKEAMDLEFAVNELEKNKGTQFDPVLAELFIRVIQEGKIVI